MTAKTIEIKSYSVVFRSDGDVDPIVEITLRYDGFGIEFSVYPVTGEDRIKKGLAIAAEWLDEDWDMHNPDECGIFSLLRDDQATRLKELLNRKSKEWLESINRPL